METKIVKIDPRHIDMEQIAGMGRLLAAGKLVAFPTETVYGLGANALDEGAVKRIYAAKGRPSDNPLIVHFANAADIKTVVREIPEAALRLLEQFSPGPLTIILKKQPCLNDTVTAGLDSVAVRIPANPVARALIAAAGVPVAAPSANLSGKPSPTRAAHVIADMDGRIDAIVDGGSCAVGVESTVLDMTGTRPAILRPGGVTYAQIKAVLPDVQIDAHVLQSVGAAETPKSPGMKYKHYAPDAEVIVVEGDIKKVRGKIEELIKGVQHKRVGVLAMDGASYPAADLVLSAGADNRNYANRLFDALREFDRRQIDLVFAEFSGDMDYGLAVKNRLYKAAGNHIIHVREK